MGFERTAENTAAKEKIIICDATTMCCAGITFGDRIIYDSKGGICCQTEAGSKEASGQVNTKGATSFVCKVIE